MQSHLPKIILLFILLTGSHQATSDVLSMPGSAPQAPNSSKGVPRPTYGDTMAGVKEQFGEPKDASGPVGKPPISRWTYEKFTVVFEGNTVIQAYVN